MLYANLLFGGEREKERGRRKRKNIKEDHEREDNEEGTKMNARGCKGECTKGVT